MRMAKETLEKTVEKLTERAEECFDSAQIQEVIADQQHIVANQQHAAADRQNAVADRQHARAKEMNTLGEALEADAVKLSDEVEMISKRTSPVPNTVSSRTDSSIAKAIPK
jgi:paraquat-inducible protein B